MAFEIKSGEAVPARSGGGIEKYPFKQMKVGDSFDIPAGSGVDAVRAAASWAGTRRGMRFSIRKRPDGSTGCWRVA
jgi:hypothetical protein